MIKRVLRHRHLFSIVIFLVVLLAVWPIAPNNTEADDISWPTLTPTPLGESVPPSPVIIVATSSMPDTNQESATQSEPMAKPTNTPKPTKTPKPTNTPKPTKTPKPDQAAEQSSQPPTAPPLIEKATETPIYTAVAPQSHEMQQMRAFWASSYNEGFRNPAEVDEMIANVVRAQANTLIVQMRRHGDSWYNRSIEPRAVDRYMAPAETFDPLDDILIKAHQYGIKVHAWLVVSVACREQDPLYGSPNHVCTAHGPEIEGPESWTTVTHDGERVGDLDFGHPSAVYYMESVVTNLIKNYPVDGIHFDFIRYSGQDYGYNQVSVDRFNRANGLPANNWPPPDGAVWSQWRRDRLTELVRRLYIRSKAINPKIEMSAATITWGGAGNYDLADFQHSAAYTRVFQDWQAWLQEGILDFAVPMHYFEERRANNQSWLDGWLAWDRQNTGRRAIVPGLGSWLNTTDENIAQVRRSLAPGDDGRFLSGVAFYAYHNLFQGSNTENRREFMDRLRSELFAQPARAPEWPWIVAPTMGMLQGIAAVNGQVVPDAKVLLIKDGVWVRDITASTDGWYGAVELEPGNYTIVVKDIASGNEARYENIRVWAGNVAHVS